MITLRKANERFHNRRRKQDLWLTFYSKDRADHLGDGFGTLESFNEDRLPPGVGQPRHPHRDAEIITYVREGALGYEDSLGRSGVIHAGEFQRMTAGCGIRHSETNASRTEWAHVFEIWLQPSEPGLAPSHERRRFCAAERRGALRIVASRDGRSDSLRIHQDASIYSAMLDPGHHVAHELLDGRRAWLHVVKGEISLGDIILSTGDGAGVTAERAVSFTAREETEILLLDLGERRPSSPNKSPHRGQAQTGALRLGGEVGRRPKHLDPQRAPPMSGG